MRKKKWLRPVLYIISRDTGDNILMVCKLNPDGSGWLGYWFYCLKGKLGDKKCIGNCLEMASS